MLTRKVTSYVPAKVGQWLEKEIEKRGLNESAIVREILLQKMSEGK